MLENHIAWLEEQQRKLLEQIRVIDEKDARYFRREGSSPEVDITDDLQASNKERLKHIEEQLRHYKK